MTYSLQDEPEPLALGIYCCIGESFQHLRCMPEFLRHIHSQLQSTVRAAVDRVSDLEDLATVYQFKFMLQDRIKVSYLASAACQPDVGAQGILEVGVIGGDKP